LISVGYGRARSAIALLSLLLLSPAIISWLRASSSRSDALAASQRVLFSTYLGGQDTQASGIAVDAYGDAYVTGITRSSSFPLSTLASFGTALPCVFVTKINPATGSIMYSTLVAGTTGASVAGIAVDSQGAAYIPGATFATDFPTTASAFQAGFAPNATQSVYVVKLEPSGSSISFSTLLGGNGIQAATAIAVDRWGAAYITGTTNSTDFPTTTGAFQTGRGSAFVSKFNADGSSLDYSTLFGGNGPDSPAGLAVDDRGSAYITGSAFSQDFPTTTGAFLTAKASPAGVDNPFVMKLNPAGSALVYSTFLGGSDGSHNRGNAIAVGADGSAVVAGTTNSRDFTMVNALFNCPRGGNLLKTIDGAATFSRSENG